MKRVMIIGSGGAGKSTLARQLGEITRLNVYHLDAIYWKPGWKESAKEEWNNRLKEILEEEYWIMDGNYGSSLEIRASAADTIIFLDYSSIRCLYRILKRRFMYMRSTRPDMAPDCKEKLDWEFVSWVASYNRKKAPLIRGILSTYKKQGKDILHLKSPKETKKFLEELSLMESWRN